MTESRTAMVIDAAARTRKAIQEQFVEAVEAAAARGISLEKLAAKQVDPLVVRALAAGKELAEEVTDEEWKDEVDEGVEDKLEQFLKYQLRAPLVAEFTAQFGPELGNRVDVLVGGVLKALADAWDARVKAICDAADARVKDISG